MAFVSGGWPFSSSMARAVGTMTSSTLRRWASCFTWSITGRAPMPVPMTSRRQLQGICSSRDKGVWPKTSRNFFEGFFSRLVTLPRSITTSFLYAMPSIRMDPKENDSRVGTLPQHTKRKSAGLLTSVSAPADSSCPSWARTRTPLIQSHSPADQPSLLLFACAFPSNDLRHSPVWLGAAEFRCLLASWHTSGTQNRGSHQASAGHAAVPEQQPAWLQAAASSSS